MLINYDHAFRGAKKRWIYVPTAASRQMGKEISVLITDRWQAPDFYYHFKSGGHVSAIELHKKHKYFVKIDIEKFFPNISRNRVVNSLKKISIPYKKAAHIADWSCVASKEDLRKRILPYGFVQSQILSALCLDKSAVGQCLRVISQDVLVSVYVDDIIISSNDMDLLQVVMDKVLFVRRQSILDTAHKNIRCASGSLV